MTAQEVNQVEFTHDPATRELIRKIAKRAVAISKKYGNAVDQLGTEMDINATHVNGNPLRLEDLLGADDSNLAHDVFGIARHLDRSTGELLNCFRPRFSQPSTKE